MAWQLYASTKSWFDTAQQHLHSHTQQISSIGYPVTGHKTDDRFTNAVTDI